MRDDEKLRKKGSRICEARRIEDQQDLVTEYSTSVITGSGDWLESVEYHCSAVLVNTDPVTVKYQ